jgi:hypothetical protein
VTGAARRETTDTRHDGLPKGHRRGVDGALQYHAIIGGGSALCDTPATIARWRSSPESRSLLLAGNKPCFLRLAEKGIVAGRAFGHRTAT